MHNNKLKSKNGYTLLLAVLTATLVLAVAAFIVSVARKQFILSEAARDSTLAFYSANTGIECAIENSAVLNLAEYSISNPVHCLGNNYTITPILDGSGNLATTSFSMPIDTSSGTSCVYVRYSQWYVSGNQITAIEARGYNIGWNPPVAQGGTGQGSGDCTLTSLRKVERALRLTYQ